MKNWDYETEAISCEPSAISWRIEDMSAVR